MSELPATSTGMAAHHRQMNAKPPVADTSFVVAIANRRDSHHTECVRVYEQFTRILLPQTVLVESAFLIRRDAGAPVVVQFLRSLSRSARG